MLADEDLAMCLLPASLLQPHQRSVLPRHDRLRHHVHGGLHLHLVVGMPSHPRALEFWATAGVHGYSCDARYHGRTEQRQ